MLSVEGLSFAIGNPAPAGHVSLNVGSGEIVGLFGVSGAGKSSFFGTMLGLRQSSRGRVIFRGLDVTGCSLSQLAALRLAYVPQDASILRTLSVESNIRLALETLTISRRERAARLDMILSSVGLQPQRHLAGGALSGGQRRRCEIARALALDPVLYVLDEPFAGVDPIGVDEISRLLRSLAERGASILLTEHRLRDALPHVDRAYLMKAGRIVYEDQRRVTKNSEVETDLSEDQDDVLSVTPSRNTHAEGLRERRYAMAAVLRDPA